MDSFSHIILGVAIADILGGKHYGNKAPLIGAILTTIPDLDVFIAPLFGIDGVDALLIHRTITHSLLFAFLTAPLRGRLVSRVIGKTKDDRRRRTVISFRCLLVHQLLDLFTGYGTQRLRPLSKTFFAIDSIFVVDPFRTIPFFVLVLVGIFYKPGHRERKKAMIAGLITSLFYLVTGIVVQQIARHHFMQTLPAQTTFLKTAVTPLNIFLRRGLAEDQDNFYLARRSVYDTHPPEDRIHIPKQMSLLPQEAITEDLFRLQKRFHGNIVITTLDDSIVASPIEFGALLGWLSGSTVSGLMGFQWDPIQKKRRSSHGGEGLPSDALPLLRQRIQGIVSIGDSQR